MKAYAQDARRLISNLKSEIRADRRLVPGWRRTRPCHAIAEALPGFTGGLKALKLIDRPGGVLRKAKERMFAA